MCARDRVICERAKAHVHGGRAYQHQLALACRTPPLPHQRGLGHVRPLVDAPQNTTDKMNPASFPSQARKILVGGLWWGWFCRSRGEGPLSSPVLDIDQQMIEHRGFEGRASGVLSAKLPEAGRLAASTHRWRSRHWISVCFFVRPKGRGEVVCGRTTARSSRLRPNRHPATGGERCRSTHSTSTWRSFTD